MKTTTYICDTCKKSVGESELTTLSISMKMSKSPSGYAATVTANKDVCKACLEKKGILVTVPEDQKHEDAVSKNQRTLEDKLVDILEELGVIFEQ
jgi:hypothetical protein